MERQRRKRDTFQDQRQRREDWYAVAEVSKKTILRCHKCPMWSFCPHQNWELSRDLQWKEEKYERPPYLYAPSQSKIEEFKELIQKMEKVKEKCPLGKLLQGEE